MLVLLLLNLLLLVLLLLVSDRALLRDIVVLVNDGVLIRLKHVVIVQIVGAASSTGRLFNASRQLSLDEIAHLMVQCGWKDVRSVIRMRLLCLLLQRSVNCGVRLLLLLLDSLKIGAELIWDLLVHANVQVPTMKSGWSLSGLMDEFGVVVLT